MNAADRRDEDNHAIVPRRHGLTFRLIALLLPISLLVMAGQFATNHYQDRAQAARAAKGYTQAQVLLTAERIETILRTATVAATSLQTFASSETDPRRLERFVRGLLDQNPTILGMAIAMESPDAQNSARYWYRRTDGSVVYRDIVAADPLFTAMEWYAGPIASGRPIWTEPYFDVAGAETNMVTFGLPVFGSGNGGKPIGVVTADLGLESLQDMVDELTMEGSGFLLSRKGVYLGRSANADALPANIFDDSAAIPLRLALAEHIRRGETGVIATKEADGSQLWTAFAPIRETGWFLAISYPMHLFLPIVDDASITLALEACLGFLLLAGAISTVIWSAIHPLAALTKAAQAVAAGNLAIPIPGLGRRRDEVALLAHAFVGMQRSLGVYIESLKRATAARERIETELAIAKEIQSSLLPEIETTLTGHTEVEVDAVMRPAREVGGDFYDVFLLDEQHLCLVIADVSDKGVPAALYMSMTRTLLRLEARTGILPDAILANVNDILARDNRACMFVTIFCMVLDLATGEAHFANAGHNPPLLAGRNMSWRFVEVPCDAAVGPIEGSTYEFRSIQLVPGNIVLFYTDGITEARNADGELFGNSRLVEALEGRQSESVATLQQHLLGVIETWAANCPQSDDITLLAFRYRA